MGYSNPADLAMINPRQLSVTKIYPGNYSNVLRYWHEVSSFSFQDPNGIDQTYANQPIGGPVGVVFKPGVIAQQAIGYVDLSFQDTNWSITLPADLNKNTQHVLKIRVVVWV